MLEGRLKDNPNSCGWQWIDYIDYCFPGDGVLNDRCNEIFVGIANDEWDSIMPAGAKCLFVDYNCFEPEAFNY